MSFCFHRHYVLRLWKLCLIDVSRKNHKESHPRLFVVLRFLSACGGFSSGKSGSLGRRNDILSWITAPSLHSSLMITPAVSLAPQPCLSSSSSSAWWCGPRSSRGYTRGSQRLPCTLSHYHASWCVGLNVCHQASKALSPTDLTHASSASDDFGSNMIIVSWIKRHESLWACYVGYVMVCLVGLSNSFNVFRGVFTVFRMADSLISTSSK